MLNAHGVTHPGLVREINEDGFLVDVPLGLYVVADGMGGHNAGEVASAQALEAMRRFLARSAEAGDFTWPYGIDPKLTLPGNRLLTSVKLANRRVFKIGESRDDYSGLGPTVVAALIEDGHVSLTGVGDSRIYAFSDGRLQQLTVDDSWASTVAASGATASHQMRHVLTNVVGAREEIDVEVTEHPFGAGATLLLCSDGLHGALDDAAIAAQLASPGPVSVIANDLVRLALERDGRDNITAVVLRWSEDEAS